MRTWFFILFSALFGTLLLNSCNKSEDKVSITAIVSEAGSLNKQYNNDTWTKVTSLKIVGNINEKDISFIKALDHNGLKHLDLSEVSNLEQIKFYFDQSKFQSVVLPNNVNSIANESFQGDVNLNYIGVDEKNKFFKVLDSVLYSASLKKIIVYPAKRPHKSFTIPASVTETTNAIFASAESLENISVENGNTSFASVNGVLFNRDTTTLIAYPSGKKDSIFTLPKKVKSVYWSSFWKSKNLKQILVEEGNEKYKSIDGLLVEKNNYTNNENSNLSLVAFPAGKVCENYTLPCSINAIKSFALYGCHIKSLTLNKNVIVLDKWAFNGADINEINISKDNQTFGCENGIIYKGSTAYLGVPSYQGTAALKKTVSIDERAFQHCNFKKITIAPTVIMGPFICSYSNIEEAVIEEGNTDIKASGAFFCCTNLKKVDLPSTIERINSYMFFGCLRMSAIICHSENVPEVDDLAFEGVDFDKCTLFVPLDAIEKYKANTKWKVFKNINAIK